MWKTLVDFSAQISRFKHILPLSTAQINCSGTDLPLFRKPYLARPSGQATPEGEGLNLGLGQMPGSIALVECLDRMPGSIVSVDSLS
jgi:hypothetical protein